MKKIFIFAMLLVAVFLCAEWTIVASYPIPEGASGLAYDGTYLYCGIYGANGDQFYRIDPDDGTYQLLFTNASIGDCFGMTWDGTNLWITDHVTNPSSAYELDINSGVILSQFDLPDQYMSGIAYDTGNFWVATYYPDDPSVIYQVDNTGTVLQQFNFDIPGTTEQPWDLCMHGSDLWIADYYDDALYKVDTSGTILETHPSESSNPAGIVWDGQYLWYCDNGSGGFDYLYKVDLGGSGTPDIQLGWDNYDFGNTTVGQPASVELPITNTGTADLSIDAMNFTAGEFYTDETLPIVITPNDSYNFTIFFDPLTYGSYSCLLTVESNDPVNPAEEVTLSGYGVLEDPAIVVSQNSINFGSVRLNAVTGRYIEISNQGTGFLEINDITFDDLHFFIDDTVSLPININAAESYDLRIWFSPDAATNFDGVMSIHSNDPVTPIYDVTLTGIGNASAIPIGGILWQYNITTGYDNSPKAIAPIPDISGDNAADVIICSEDNFVRCFNGNASGTGDILWETEIYSGNIYTQNSLNIIEDLDADGYDDVIVGTTGGDRAIRALSGKTGEFIWIYFTNQYSGSGGWVYQVDATFDYNNDGITDVLAATGSEALRVFCIDGTNGTEIWNFYVAGPKFSCIGIEDVTGDGIPDAIGGASNSNETEGKVFGINGANGSQLWEFTTGGSSVWALSQVDDVDGDGIEDVVAGDFAGNYYALNTTNGSILWSGSVGTCLIIRFETLNDVNSDGHPDIAIARSSIDNAVVIDGYTGQNIWLQPVADQPWVVDKIGDITGDGINDVVWGTLFGSNFGYFLDGATGNVLSQTPVGSACDAIAGIPDIVNDGSWEMVIGGRNGTVLCVSGGEVQPVIPGYLEGYVTLNGGPGPVVWVEITVGGITVHPDSTGYFFLELDPGTYEITVTLEGYQLPIIEDIVITSGETTTFAITLNYLFPPQNLSYTIEGNDVVLEWDEPQSSREVTSYKVYRDDEEIAEVTDLFYTDEDLIPAIYEYYVTAIYEEVQESEPSNTVNVELTTVGNNLVPLETRLNGNYPNPFNPSTIISFELAESSPVELVIYNMKGQKVKELMNSNLDAGYYKIVWNGKDDQNHAVSSGIYFYKMKSGKYISTGKCILLK
ncbi:MAG: choice-of-anchor D domain-containing protein [Candidatus Cloacimonetes bacterium]|nr:choice-of-anchor D domain-containing protein [Candidatus Cloacimonadota bacterium]MBL7148584.1 choice-of-anchor D domain-containing protein [Candidatus Cloacimonadota bacterium]